MTPKFNPSIEEARPIKVLDWMLDKMIPADDGTENDIV